VVLNYQMKHGRVSVGCRAGRPVVLFLLMTLLRHRSTFLVLKVFMLS